MKAITIALKDLQHVFQNIFSLAMMLGAPLFITGLLYFAFGGLSNDGGYSLPVTKVQIANLDEATSFAAGDMLVDFLQDDELSQIIQITTAQDEASARRAVDARQAGVALIIPADFSTAVVTPERSSSIQLYADPTLTIGPGIVKDLLSHFLDGFSGAKISAQVAAGSLASAGLPPNPRLQAQAAQSFSAWQQSAGHENNNSSPRLVIQTPGNEQPVPAQGAGLIGPVMAGMLVFFLFYMGANSAERIILEDEQGTLARMFATPTRLSTILLGKFLGIVAILLVQLILLLLASRFLFSIHWGNPGAILLVSLSLIVVSAGFGVMLMSFVKNSRQTGPVLGGVMTLTGMLGGLFTTGFPSLPASFEKVTLLVPQGWALLGWEQTLAGAAAAQILLPVGVMLGMGGVFLFLGVAIFRKRYS